MIYLIEIIQIEHCHMIFSAIDIGMREVEIIGAASGPEVSVSYESWEDMGQYL